MKSKGKSYGYLTKGVYHCPNITTMVITELPIGMWTEDYKEFLDSITIDVKKTKGTKITIMSKQFLKSYQNHSTESDVHFILKFTPSHLLPDLVLTWCSPCAQPAANNPFK